MSEQPVIVAVDQGTTSVRAAVMGADLEPRGIASETIPRAFPRPGWVELDADRVVDATRRVVRDAIDKSGVAPMSIAGVGIANQGETALAWERKGARPLGPAVVWQCRRTEPDCAKLRDAGIEPDVKKRTGLPIDAYFSATKIAWILNQGDAMARAERGEICAGTLDTYTVFRLTQGAAHVTDPSTACRTQLAELATGRFSEELCRVFGVPSAVLADVLPSDVGRRIELDFEGLRLPLLALLCDQPAALLGTGCTSTGDLKCTYGTGAFVQANAGVEPPPIVDDGLLRSIAWQLGESRTYLLEGSILAAGDVLTWLRDELRLLDDPREVERILVENPSSKGVRFLPALTGLGAPRWQGSARGLILGLHRGATDRHLVRAALEGIAHLVADVLERMRGALGRGGTAMRADGGVSASSAFLQLQADIAGVGVRRCHAVEATTRGIGLLAACAAGLVPDLAKAATQRSDLNVMPQLDAGARAELRRAHADLIELACDPRFQAGVDAT